MVVFEAAIVVPAVWLVLCKADALLPHIQFEFGRFEFEPPVVLFFCAVLQLVGALLRLCFVDDAGLNAIRFEAVNELVFKLFYAVLRVMYNTELFKV